MGKLCKPPLHPSSCELTREIHANLQDVQDDKVYMRDTYIDIPPININQYFGIPHLEEEHDYTAMLGPTILETEISTIVTKDGHALKKSWTSIPRAQLNEEA